VSKSNVEIVNKVLNVRLDHILQNRGTDRSKGNKAAFQGYHKSSFSLFINPTEYNII
jgi:hypothetical protein